MPRYKQAMKEAVMDPQDQMRACDALRQELARGDVALSGVVPVLSHLLACPGQALVSEDVLARMQGMLGDLARQVIAAHAEFGEKGSPTRAGMQSDLAMRLASSSIVVSHCYAIAMESQLGDRLEQSGSIDQVLTPLLQELIASPEESTAELAMATMSAQARFVQAQRRMDMSLGELPSELFPEVLALGRKVCAASEPGTYERAEKALRASYDESVSRLGLLTRLVGGLSGGIRAALDLEHAGLALFATALARRSRQSREQAILSCHERQLVRLALALRSGGLKPEEIARQFVVIHRDLAVPHGIKDVAPEEAVALLKGAAAGRWS
jgi:hypothetical protein